MSQHNEDATRHTRDASWRHESWRAGTLVDFYADYAPVRFQGRTGNPLSKRGYQRKARHFDLPIIRTGDGCLIDPIEADKRLAAFAHQPAAREVHRPGRPVGAKDGYRRIRRGVDAAPPAVIAVAASGK